MSANPTPTAHVLFVDDEEPNLIVFRAALASHFPVLTANNAEMALELMRMHEVAVLLADQRMPGTTGVQFLAQAQRLQPHAVRMFVTAYSNLQAAIDAINEGKVRRYISKPWNNSALLATVTDAYEVYQTERALRTLEKRLLETERYYALGVVSAGITHELRNPASWISNSAELCLRTLHSIREELDGENPDKDRIRELLARGEGLLASTLDGGRRIAEIVAAVEGPTRHQESDQEVDLNRLWAAISSLVHYHTRGQVPVQLTTDASWPAVKGSSTALGQVLSNVLINATEAVNVQPEAAVWVGHRVEADRILIEIEDNGPGVAEEDRERIFDPFHTAGKTGGSGLGLAISRRIAREHGGDLVVDKSPRGGARFTLKLPTAQAH